MNAKEVALILAAVRREVAKIEPDLSRPLRFMEGPPGKDGIDGRDGKDGKDGQNGVSVRSLVIAPTGHLIITLDDGTVMDAGPVKGERGPRGPRGPSGSGTGGAAGATWGQITGALSDQSDLQAALDAKQAAGDYATVSQLPITGVVTLNVPANALEDVETFAAPGVAPTNRVSIWLAPHTDDDENSPELLDIAALQATPAADQITVTAAFLTRTSGPIKLQWSAF